MLTVVTLGLIFGSFGTVLLTRLRADESVVRPGSHCRNCNTQLAWRDNIPVLSYLLLRGKCRSCKSTISWIYPLVEISTALLFLIAYVATDQSAATLALMGLATVTPPLVLIDIEEKRLPNKLTAALVICSFLAGLIAVANGSADSAITALKVSFLLGAVFFLIHLIFKGGLGLGDVKLVVGLGLALGLISWKAPVVSVVIAFILATIATLPSIVRRDFKRAIPFGPFLLAGAWIAVLGGARLHQLVLSLWGIQ